MVNSKFLIWISADRPMGGRKNAWKIEQVNAGGQLDRGNLTSAATRKSKVKSIDRSSFEVFVTGGLFPPCCTS